jgi:hypothetical protein
MTVMDTNKTPAYVTPYDKLLSEADEIQRFAEITVSDNPEEIIERINALCVYIARTGKMLADAKYHLARKCKDETMEVIKEILRVNNMSKKVQDSKIDGICADEKSLVVELNRLNASLTHQLDAMRSLLSYEKENMRNLGYQK